MIDKKHTVSLQIQNIQVSQLQESSNTTSSIYNRVTFKTICARKRVTRITLVAIIPLSSLTHSLYRFSINVLTGLLNGQCIDDVMLPNPSTENYLSPFFTTSFPRTLRKSLFECMSTNVVYASLRISTLKSLRSPAFKQFV